MFQRHFGSVLWKLLGQSGDRNILKALKAPGKDIFSLSTFLTTHYVRLNLFNRVNLLLRMIFKSSESIDFTQLSTQKRVAGNKARGMKKLDKTLFECCIRVLGVLLPHHDVADFRKRFKNQVLRVNNVKPILEISQDSSQTTQASPNHQPHDQIVPFSSDYKIVLLDPRHFTDLQHFQHTFLSSPFQIPKNRLHQVEVELDYSNWNYDEVLSQILPQGESVGGFSIIGHIAHLNLKERLLPHKHIIGQVILDKVSSVSMVVNKLQSIEHTFRNFEMEVIAGEGDFTTCVKEHGFIFKFDFSQVYWNPRLATEHQRLVALFQPDDVIFDVFCGVGPFVVPAAKKGCRVIANDLNPHSVQWLKQNLVCNKIAEDRVHVFGMDGVQFVEEVFGGLLRRGDLDHKRCHVLMNLPATAVSFLTAFVGLCSGAVMPENHQDSSLNTNLPIFALPPSTTLSTNTPPSTTPPSTTPPSTIPSSTIPPSTLPPSTPPSTIPPSTLPPSTIPPSTPPSTTTHSTLQPSTVIVHCYTFSKHDDPEREAIQQVKEALGISHLNHHEQSQQLAISAGEAREVELNLSAGDLTFLRGAGVQRVRHVAPGKHMVCVSFFMPPSLLRRCHGFDDELAAKKAKLE